MAKGDDHQFLWGLLQVLAPLASNNPSGFQVLCRQRNSTLLGAWHQAHPDPIPLSHPQTSLLQPAPCNEAGAPFTPSKPSLLHTFLPSKHLEQAQSRDRLRAGTNPAGCCHLRRDSCSRAAPAAPRLLRPSTGAMWDS